MSNEPADETGGEFVESQPVEETTTPVILTEFVEDVVPASEDDVPEAVTTRYVSWLEQWSKPAAVRATVTGLIVVVVCFALLCMLGGVLLDWITTDEAKELGAPTLFSGLLALAGSVVGYYFADRK